MKQEGARSTIPYMQKALECEEEERENEDAATARGNGVLGATGFEQDDGSQNCTRLSFATVEHNGTWI